MLFYIITFFLCFLLDLNKSLGSNKIVRHVFIIWLYIFLCFGYMTGSDWRAYELIYNQSNQYVHSFYEKGFYLLFNFLHLFIKDFFITLALLKCLYLYSLIRILRKVTDKWLSAVALLFPISLLFMLIDNPLRFMVASIIINFALYYLIDGNYKKYLLIAIWAPFFHITTLLIIPIFLLVKFRKRINAINKIVLIIAYILFSLICSNIYLSSTLMNEISSQLILLGSKSYDSYLVQNNNSFFTIGSVINVFLAIILIYYRDTIINSNAYGDKIYCISIFYLFLFRILLIVPTGFRLAIPFGYFYAISMLCIIYNSRAILKYIITLIFAIIMIKNVYTGYVYIPYSNSIYYIITGHKSYYERSRHNYDYYQKRMGKQYDINQQ